MDFFFIFIIAVLPLGGEIGLREALKLLKEKNYDAKMFEYEVKKSEGEYIQSALFQNPVLSVNYTGLTFGGKHIVYDHSNTLFSVRIDQPIELGNKRRYRKLSALYQLRTTEYLKGSFIRFLSLGLIYAYFQALADRAYLEYLQKDLEDFGKILAIQEQKQKSGLISVIDFLKLQLYELELKKALTQASATYKRDLEEFNFYLGGGEYQPADTEKIPEEVKLDELIEKSIQRRESIKAIQEQIKSLDYEVKLIRAYRFPDISVGLEYDSFGVNYKPGIGFGLSLLLPVFNVRQGDLITALATKEQLLVSLKREEASIKKEISVAFEDYEASKQIFQSYLERRVVMDDLLERTKKAYLLGGISTLDFLDTLRTHRSFMNAFLQARYLYIQNYYRLKILAGEDDYEN
ncbi:Cobalt-zinc-cadmium resistance protein CzcC [bacterium HR19]|nr:Cobalt-zinc-cadmium resistance protein CzcC [bacterium HR19]